MDNDSYLKSLEDNYNTYKEEIEGLVEARQMEERINKFIASSEAHIKMKMNHRQLVQDNLNVKDNIVNFILEDNNINKWILIHIYYLITVKIIVVPFKTVTSKNIWGQDYIPVGCWVYFVIFEW